VSLKKVIQCYVICVPVIILSFYPGMDSPDKAKGKTFIKMSFQTRVRVNFCTKQRDSSAPNNVLLVYPELS